MTGIFAGVVAAFWSISASRSTVLAQARQAAEAPHLLEGGLPIFERDGGWPKFPAKYKAGFGSDVESDAQGHVWVLMRTRALEEEENKKPAAQRREIAPSVLEFDQSGNFIQGWGGKDGPNYKWPANEHGLTIDSKGFVWILGSAEANKNNPAHLPADSQILKFDRNGKFVMAIGKYGQSDGSNKTEVLHAATNMFVYDKTNELFVSDGEVNSRIIVFDATTGKFKRMWGAYGNVPLDEADRAKRPLTELDPNANLGPDERRWLIQLSQSFQQFGEGVHDVKISNDGLVYVADRGNKRIQVFTTEGKFLAEQFLALDRSLHLQVSGLALSPDQRFLYVTGFPGIYILNRKTLENLGTFRFTDDPNVQEPPHLIGTDTAGNFYVAAGPPADKPGHGGPGAIKFNLKGYTPRK